MLQKYIITKDSGEKGLKIKEYAVVVKSFKKTGLSLIKHEEFSLIGEENYDGKTIKDSISKGLESLIVTLRTHNMFPIEPYAAKIAKSIIELYDFSEERSIELFFNDIDLFEEDTNSEMIKG
jgi:hypothetical protein